MYAEIPREYFEQFFTHRETITFVTFFLIPILILLIYNLSRKTSIEMLHRKLLKDSKIFSDKDREDLEKYHPSLRAEYEGLIKLHKYGIVTSIVTALLILFVGVYHLNQPSIENLLKDFEKNSGEVLTEDLKVYKNLETNRFELFKIDSTYYQLEKGYFVEVDKPANLGLEV